LATLTWRVVVAESPLSSVTFRPTVYVPAFANEREAVPPVASPNVPSLFRSHDCEASVPSGSLDDDVKVTVSPVLGEAGALEKAAVGALLATVTWRVVVAESPLSSVTFRPTV